MPPSPKLYHLACLWVELTRQLHKMIAADLQAKFGSHAGDLLIDTAVFIGTVEERPMTATKLANYVGMPRPTVIRRLNILRRRGSVERRGSIYRTPAKRLQRVVRKDHGALAKLVCSTHERLSR
ncbi:helix-turn-helix domain-containing protein [Bradyrhizobium sp. BR 1433]|uniref:helix-turn-helix domain-containing protein n=1 Tax=Bradyrhizobium sp. BR 1433 TaxID=3447967 RepID=UPI003EE53F95